jgi:copper oxidase (laccase) domain-containing protein
MTGPGSHLHHDAAGELWTWQAGATHAIFSARAQGNIGGHVGDDLAQVTARRGALAERAGLDPGDVAGVTQVHGADVWLDLARSEHGVDEAVRWSAGASSIEADALVTARPGIGVAVGVADCLPIALAWGDATGVIHAGWRGLAGGVIEATFALVRRAAGPAVAMADHPPRAVIGPALRACCLEVGEEVAAQFPPSSIVRRDGAPRPFLDAAADARRRLEALGAVVDDVQVCTRCDPQHRLFSHRGDTAQPRQGRQAVLAWRDPAPR